MNKHLLRIINEYSFLKLKFKQDLLDSTQKLLEEHHENWYYYDEYIVCSEDYNLSTPHQLELVAHKRGNIFNHGYKYYFQKDIRKWTFITK
jgi:hypothetical protein